MPPCFKFGFPDAHEYTGLRQRLAIKLPRTRWHNAQRSLVVHRNYRYQPVVKVLMRKDEKFWCSHDRFRRIEAWGWGRGRIRSGRMIYMGIWFVPLHNGSLVTPLSWSARVELETVIRYLYESPLQDGPNAPGVLGLYEAQFFRPAERIGRSQDAVGRKNHPCTVENQRPSLPPSQRQSRQS